MAVCSNMILINQVHNCNQNARLSLPPLPCITAEQELESTSGDRMARAPRDDRWGRCTSKCLPRTEPHCDGTEKLNDLPRVTQEVCGRAGGMKPSVLNSTLPLTHSPCFSGDTTEIRRNVEGVQCRWSQVYTSCEFGSGGRKVKRCVHETGLGPYVPTSSAGLQAPIAGALK
ncbi:unnamed protein product [Eretmochelys imbricata]